MKEKALLASSSLCRIIRKYCDDNLGQVSRIKPGEKFETGRFLFWTEDNRMHVAADDKFYSYYNYDHSGERRLKLIGRNDLLDVNADIMATYTMLNEPTLYPSAYMVLTNKGYTKHYYAGTERVAARIGGGNLDHDTACIVADEEAMERADRLFDWCLRQVKETAIAPLDLSSLDIRTIDGDRMDAPWWLDEAPAGLEAGLKLNVWKLLHAMDLLSSPSTVPPDTDDEPDVYFYHSDHLGSASWITEVGGKPVQHIQYLPYGEPFLNQRVGGYNERFTFTGKERDEETGYSYFSARYLDHEILTSFLSVDRYADKYPSISPYAYCAWNPIRLVDPSGDTVIVTGAHADRVIDQLQTGQMAVSRDENGFLSADLRGKSRNDLTYEERLIFDAINSTKVTVNITAEKTQKVGDKNVFRVTVDGKRELYECLWGGSNMGSYYNPNTGTAASFGFIDMDLVEANGFDQGVAHEVSEYYISGHIAIRDRSDVRFAEQGVRNPQMMEAHTKAIPEILSKGGIYQFGIKYGNMGRIK